MNGENWVSKSLKLRAWAARSCDSHSKRFRSRFRHFFTCGKGLHLMRLLHNSLLWQVMAEGALDMSCVTRVPETLDDGTGCRI